MDYANAIRDYEGIDVPCDNDHTYRTRRFVNLTVEEELAERAKAFAANPNRWVRSHPGRPQQMCLVVNGSPDARRHVEVSQAGNWILSKVLDGKSLTTWNDREAHNVYDVIQVLEKGSALAGELGI